MLHDVEAEQTPRGLMREMKCDIIDVVVNVTSCPPGVLPLPAEPGRGQLRCEPAQRICSDTF